jgi:hypothetical protein
MECSLMAATQLRLATIVCVASSLLAMPGILLGAESDRLARAHVIGQVPAAETPPRDVALLAGNLLQGQVVDTHGMAQANCEVWVSRESGSSIKTRTDASGRFGVRELPAGIYRIETAAGGAKFRLWAPNSGPAAAQSSVLIVVAPRIASG